MNARPALRNKVVYQRVQTFVGPLETAAVEGTCHQQRTTMSQVFQGGVT